MAASILPVPAQDYLAPLVVTASRVESPADAVPYSFESIPDRELRENTIRTLPDALRLVPGVLVQKTAYGHGSPFIRGFTGRRNLLLVDGIRINNSTFRGGPIQTWNTIDPFSLERIELIRSQGSVLYGSDAVGGTLNAFSESSGFRDRPPGAAFAAGSSYYEYRSNGRDSHIGRLEAETGIGGRFGIHLGLSAKEFGDIRDSSLGLMKNTGYPERDLDARLDWDVSPHTTLTLLHQNVSQDDVSRWHSTLDNPGWTHDGHLTAPGTFVTREFDQDRTLSYLRLANLNETAGAPVRRATATVSYQTSEETEFQIRTPADKRSQSYDTETFGIDFELESPLAGGSLLYGIDHYHDSVGSSASRDRGAGSIPSPALRPVADDSTYDLSGIYTQYIRPFGDSLELTGGLRYTRAQADLGKLFDEAAKTDVSASESWDDLSASLRATWRIDPSWTAFGGVSQAFRAPNLNDLSGNLTSRSGIASMGSLNVEPEEFVTWELGVRKSETTHGVTTSLFHTSIGNTITSIPTPADPKVSVTTNGSDGYIYGVEMEGYWTFTPCWTLSGFAAWQDGRIETPVFLGGPTKDEYSSRLLPLSGSLALRWSHPTLPLWAEARVLASTLADRLSRSDREDDQRIPTGGTPSHAVASLRAGFDPTAQISLTAAVENIFDDDYRIHGSGQNEPGINTILGLKYRW